MAALSDLIGRFVEFLSIPLFKLGKEQVTLWTLLYLIVLFFLLFYVTAKLRTWLVDKLLAKSTMGLGARQALGSIIRYIVIAIGFLIILQTAGIDLTSLNVLAGAVGIGVGFGLQNIVSNFISGLIILFERPIKIGDRIEVGDVEGDVIRIGGRSTTVVTNDNITIIVPNSKFISENVVNWSHMGRKVRFKIPVIVGYDSDERLVGRLLLEVAADNQDVLKQPPPVVRLMEFGENGLRFELRIWSTTLIHRKGRLTSDINFAILEKFRALRIEVHVPMMDIRIPGGSTEGKSTEGQPVPEKED